MVLFSDLHLHTSHPVVGKDYLDIGINAMKQVMNYALSSNEKNILHLGDTFQLKDRIPARVWNAFFTELKKWEDEGLYSYFLKGNHDFQTDISIEAFRISKNAYPIIVSTMMTLERNHCLFIPYGEEMPKKEKGDFLFLHNSFRDCTEYSNSIVPSEGFNINITNSFTYTFAGHAHKFQELKKNKVWHIGSPYQVNFNEVGEEKFFAHIRDGKISFHKFEFPEFKIISIEDFTTKVDKCYVKVGYNSQKYTDSDAREFKKSLFEKGALGVKLDPQYQMTVKHRIKVKKRMQEIDYMKEYIKLNGGKLKHKTLYDVGAEIIEMSKEEN